MANGMRIVAEQLRLIPFGDFAVGFVPVGFVFTHPIRILSMKNTTNVSVLVSYDGETIQEYLPASSGIVFDFTANSSPDGRYPFIPAGTTVYVGYDTVAPTSGVVAVSAYYCAGD